jgi:phosphonate transport system ATP-binding protein
MAGLAVAAAAPTAPAAVAGQLPAVVIRGLSKRFGDKEILRGIDLSIGSGDVVALIGANGAGKSTLLRCALRLVEPDSGSVAVLGTETGNLGRQTLRRLRARVGFVFQRHNLVPRLSVLSNVIHGAQSRRPWPLAWSQSTAPRAMRDEAMDCLGQVHLDGLAAQRADRLSGGQSQRVAIARALMQRPAMMFADEPVASLDPAAGEEVMALFVDLSRRRNLTVLFTTHAMEHATKYGERVVGLRDGRVALDSGASALDASRLRRFFE